MNLQKYEVSGVKPGAFNFNGIEYDHESISDDIAKDLIEKGYPYLKAKGDSAIAQEPQLIDLPPVENVKKIK